MRMTRRKQLLYILILILIVSLMLGSSAYLQTLLQGTLRHLEAFHEAHAILAVALFILLAALSIPLGPFSSVPLVPFATEIWSTGWTLGLLLSGWLLGNSAAYAIGRNIGEAIVSKIIGRKRLIEWLSIVQKRISFGFLLLFRIATPSETGYLFGLIKYSFAHYLLLTIIAEAPFAIITAWAGEAVLQANWWYLVFLGLAWVALILLATTMFRRRYRASAKS